MGAALCDAETLLATLLALKCFSAERSFSWEMEVPQLRPAAVARGMRLPAKAVEATARATEMGASIVN